MTVSAVWVVSPASGSALVSSEGAAFADSAPAPALDFAGADDSPFTDASSICATSRTSTSSRASPLLCSVVSPSESITRQNGQPTAIWSAPVATASLVRFVLIRSPIVSSIHIRAPPAPQQKERSLLRGISTKFASGITSSSSRGGE